MKRQKFIEGSFVEIQLSDTKKAIGRLLPNFELRVYNKVFESSENVDLDDLVNQEIFFEVGIFKWVITKGYFSVIGYKELSEAENANRKPKFWQDKYDMNNCILLYPDGREENVTPQECVGLESTGAFDDIGVVKRINDHLNGNKFYYGFFNNLIRKTDAPNGGKVIPEHFFNFPEGKWPPIEN